ncbi:MAG: type II toxin-antitoxin system mRNA interferase toxin, RelE/StbE family [bacterium]|nr:type II toxin-antitoxin system mRNA interferase toxin, RelE/StbE family [bacterium]
MDTEIEYSSKFERMYKKLPIKIKEISFEREKFFRKNPFDPSLETHKLSGRLGGRWAFSITHKYRVYFSFHDNGVVRFHAIGNHDIYK